MPSRNGPPTKAVAEREKLEAEARQADAIAAYNRALASGQLAQAEVTAIMRDREKQKREKELAADEHYRVYRFLETVNGTTAQKCMNALSTWSRVDPECEIEIWFTSPGGDVIAGMALYDFIQELRRREHHVTTVALGYAASMAGILLQAGDKRVMNAEAWLLIHEASFGAFGSFGEVEDTVKWVERIQERILGIFAERSNLSKAQIKRRWHRKDWWISSDEALEFGFVDEVR